MTPAGVASESGVQMETAATHRVPYPYGMSLAQLESPRYEPTPPPGFLAGAAASVGDRIRGEAFVWTIAHELRQPLSTMTTAVAVMERDSPSGATAHAIGVMGRQLRQMSRMVEDLVDAARLSTGKVSLIPQLLDIREVMTDAAADMTAAAAERGQLLDVNCGPTPLWVTADRQRLCQVFSNLLQNAIKFTGHGGLITFTAEGHRSGISVRVGDTGRGIDRPGLLRIFDRFAQIQPSEQRGLGIGLSVVREILTLHRGRIEAHSDGLGKGSEFVVTLPSVDDGTS